MSWRKKEIEMVNELNEKVFSKDPLRVVSTAYYSLDVINSNYIKELKNREKYNPQDFDGSLIEKHKYDYLKRSCGDRIPGYICRFRDGSYWAWNLNKVEPVWYNKDLPTTTHFENNNFKSKTIGDLKLKDGVRLI